MGFSSREELREFLEDAPRFEKMLVRAEIELFKYYLDITKDEQKARVADRRKDPLKQWKLSPIDNSAQKHWKEYSAARDEMLSRTTQPHAPWIIVCADKKKRARLATIRDLLSRAGYKGKSKRRTKPDRKFAFEFTPKTLTDGRLAP